MAVVPLKLVTPSTENRTVTPRRRPNAELRTREYLTEAEVAKLAKAAKGNRYGHRDATMILLAYRHGLRAIGAGWPALGSDRLHGAACGSPRPARQTRHTKHPPATR
jgi:hypothetical protein